MNAPKIGAPMPLTDPEMRSLKAADKDVKVSDFRGLYLFVRTSGTKIWRMKSVDLASGLIRQ